MMPIDPFEALLNAKTFGSTKSRVSFSDMTGYVTKTPRDSHLSHTHLDIVGKGIFIGGWASYGFTVQVDGGPIFVIETYNRSSACFIPFRSSLKVASSDNVGYRGYAVALLDSDSGKWSDKQLVTSLRQYDTDYSYTVVEVTGAGVLNSLYSYENGLVNTVINVDGVRYSYRFEFMPDHLPMMLPFKQYLKVTKLEDGPLYAIYSLES